MLKLPSFNWPFKRPKLSGIKKPKRKSLAKIWKEFFKSIPREFKSVAKSHKHFLVFGNKSSGKSQLIEGLIEQSQDIYPFEMSFRAHPELQLHLGPKQVIHEISYDSLLNRSIRFRKHLIRLWKRLFIAKDPVCVITHNCFSLEASNPRESGKQARLVVGKLVLLSEIRKKPIKVRLALTHMDLLEGYLEFARFLKQQNIAFSIPVSSNFKSESLKEFIEIFYETHLSLILRMTSAEDFVKIQSFFKELPLILPMVEEYLRTLVAREPKMGPVELESVFLSSASDPSTSFAPFEWDRSVPISIFFRYPMLKHQVAASIVLFIGLFFVTNNYLCDYRQLKIAKQKARMLELLPSTSFVEGVVPEINPSNYIDSNPLYLKSLPRFFKADWQKAQSGLAKRIRKRIFEPLLRRLLIQDHCELQALNLLGLIHANEDNALGQFIKQHVGKWSQNLKLDKNLILTYINYSGLKKSPMRVEYLSRSSLDSPLTCMQPWSDFLASFEDIFQEPVTTELKLLSLKEQAQNFIMSWKKLKKAGFHLSSATT